MRLVYFVVPIGIHPAILKKKNEKKMVSDNEQKKSNKFSDVILIIKLLLRKCVKWKSFWSIKLHHFKIGMIRYGMVWHGISYNRCSDFQHSTHRRKNGPMEHLARKK